jgi:uncharacterized protein (DUF58 family)
MSDLGQLSGRRRTPARPGPGPIAEGIVEAISISIDRRVRGLHPGDHRAHGLGSGFELDRVRPYVPGDDVRRIDWNVTARTLVPHVREHVPERRLTTWLLLDRSPSMHFGTAERRKADVAEGVALVVGRLATRRGNRLGVVTFGGGAERVVAPATGRRALLGLFSAIHDEPPLEGFGPTSPGRALQIVARSRAGGDLLVLVSDMRGATDWRSPLAEVAERQAVLAVEIGDPREDELVDVGEVTFVDPESGRLLRVDTANGALRAAFSREAAAERARLAAELRQLAIRHVRLSTSGDWLLPLARGLGAIRRAA